MAVSSSSFLPDFAQPTEWLHYAEGHDQAANIKYDCVETRLLPKERRQPV